MRLLKSFGISFGITATLCAFVATVMGLAHVLASAPHPWGIISFFGLVFCATWATVYLMWED